MNANARDTWRRLRGIGVGLLVAAGLLPAWRAGLLEKPELWLHDARCRFLPAWTAGAAQPPGDIAIVAVDQNSLDYVQRHLDQRWPWPREFYGKLLDELRARGARAVVFDQLFTEPDLHRVDIAVEESDAALVAATARGRVIHAYALARQGLPPDPDELAALRRAPRPAFDPAPAWALPAHTAAALPAPEFAAAAAALGFANAETDFDNVLRRMPLLARLDDTILPALALATAWTLADRPAAGAAGRALALGDRRIPVDRRGCMWLRWYRPPAGAGGVYPYIPAADLLSDAVRRPRGFGGRPPLVADTLVSNRFVLIGSTATGLLDIKSTPLNHRVPGVEVQATALANLLRGDAIRRLPAGVTAAALLAVCLAVGALSAQRHGAVWSGAVVAAGLALLFGGGVWALSRGWMLDLAPLMAGGTLSLAGTTYVNYLVERRQSRLVRDIFEHYLDSSVVKNLIAHPERVRLGGESRDGTVLFTDVANFTNTSEKLGPEQLVRFMNSYLDAMTAIVLDEGGFVDKFIGDEIMAIFGAPNDMPDHALRACRTIVRMYRRIEELQPAFTALGANLPVFSRSGLSTGPMIVGNMGSESRMNYTAMGDTINIGSRIESLTKVYGTRTLVSAATVQAAGDAFIFREVDMVQVKGKETGVPVFELIEEPARVPAERRAALTAYTDGLRAFRARDWDGAERLWSPLAAAGDGPAAVMLARCRDYRADPPPTDWTGVHVMKTK